MFRSYTKKLKCSLRVKHDISEVIDISTSEDMENVPPVSWMRFCMNFTSGVYSSKTLCLYNNKECDIPILLLESECTATKPDMKPYSNPLFISPEHFHFWKCAKQ